MSEKSDPQRKQTRILGGEEELMQHYRRQHGWPPGTSPPRSTEPRQNVESASSSRQ